MRELVPYFINPSHYLGTEVNSVHKEPETLSLRWGLAFPDLYQVGMSYTGQRILYHQLNARPRYGQSASLFPTLRLPGC
jgi:hypothetical protein